MKFCSDMDYDSLEEVAQEYPGAAAIIEVDGGWGVFDDITDLEVWMGQE